ncbi:MAG TPA: o-succinylbenzoate synthase [Lacunisphaera sp.]|jgi:O-succinylbenzoate synthase|nr:o-succinylbenzoate synthase [Lacunisphaera sp.]
MDFAFQFRSYRRPLRAPLRTAHGWWAEREGIIVRLADDSGRVGIGEIAPIPWFGTETLAEAGEICRKLGDRPRDEDLDAIPPRFGCVRFAMACAKAQIVGRDFRIPPMVNHSKRKAGYGDPALQAGHGDPAPQTPLRRLPVAALLPAGRESRATLRARLEAGFLAFKWKVGVAAIDEELGWLDELLAELPPHARLRLDANGAWNRRQAARWLERCAARPVEFVEQPVPPSDPDALLGLAADYPVKLALDESVVRLDEARDWQERGWPGVFVIKPALAGPLSELASWVKSTNADVVISSAIETVVGRSAILQWVLAGDLTSRALGFGAGAVFGDAAWDGPILGPFVDAGAIAADAGETLWQSLGREEAS